MRKKKTKSITLIGRRWFKRGPGTTYHSVEIIVNGIEVHKIEYAYGYGSQYEWNARMWLDKNGYVPGIVNKEGTPGECLWRYCDRMKIFFTNTVTDVSRKKDL